MMTSSFRRTTILLLLVAVCVTSSAWATGPRAAKSSARRVQGVREPAGLVLLHQLWGTLRSLWSEEGCHIDPSGLCVSSPAPPPNSTLQTDSGCGIDPSGRCHS